MPKIGIPIMPGTYDRRIGRSDRRDRHRAPMGTKVKWSSNGHNWYEGNARDISTTGMMLMDQHPAPLGSSVTLVFNLPNYSDCTPFVVEGEVVRTVDRYGRHLGHGLHFNPLDDFLYTVFQEYICRLLGLSKHHLVSAGSHHNTTNSSLDN